MKKLLVVPLLMLAFPLSVGFPLHAAPKTKASKAKASSKPTTPKAGSAERKAIMDAMRVPVQKETKYPVIFKVDSLKMQGDWAFYSGNALHKDGKPITQDFLWGEMAALLQKQKTKHGKKWKVLHWGFATDVGVCEESKRKYPQAPRGIFPF